MTTIEPLICPECQAEPAIWDGDRHDPHKIIRCCCQSITDSRSLTTDQLVALWNERCKKILQTKKETK